ncbi:hypothetical protein ACE4RV_03380 [Acetobacter persici]|uniref:hypothetical protein n=1 Tax=Acetobacter persici TaxID=1076596 RepID=UPI0036DD059D
MRLIRSSAIVVFAMVGLSQYAMAEENDNRLIPQHIHYAVAGIAQDSCGKFYENYNPQIINKYHFETLSFVSGFITAYNMEESIYGKIIFQK